jgi:hypothetical protein
MAILHGQKKKVLKEVIRYYVETTEKSYQDFILGVQKARGKVDADLDYPEWLAVKSYLLLGKHSVTMEDCVENKDIINAAINEDKSRNEGEFYTPEVWCSDGREYLKRLLGDQWGKAYIWDASCGTGNLLRTIDYPREKIFMSSILAEDIEMVNDAFPGVNAFKLDFVNEIDYDDNNKFFSRNLPPELLKVLENNEPIVFYMNPPYKVMEANSSDVGGYMAANGMAKCALDIFHQFMYRMVLIKRDYKLTNMYMGIFGPVTMYHSKMIKPLYDEFKKDFKFYDGMCFDAGDFSNTSESVGWIVGYTTWRTKIEGEEDKSIVLDAKAIDQDNTISVIGKRLITSIDENLHDWVAAKDIIRYDSSLPVVTTYSNFLGTMLKSPVGAMGYMMSSNFVIRATRRACVTTLPNPDNIPITEENFWRCVASFTARRCYATKVNPYNNCQYYSKPDTSIEGYNEWLIDALIVFLFDFSAHQSAYRDVEQDGASWNISNKMFPISMDILSQVVTDQVILDDMKNNPAQNHFILTTLQQVQDSLSPEALELYRYALQLILESLHGTKRLDLGYANWTNAWDAGLLQIRNVKGLLPKEQEDRYSYLLSKLKHKLFDGIYKYGFMMDTAFASEENDVDFEDEETLEEEGDNQWQM